MELDLDGAPAFEGQLVLITGATGDLGRVMVRSFAASGADVAIHYLRNEQMAEQMRQEVVDLGRRAIVVQADITKRDQVNAMRDTVLAQTGVPDIVVNNAVVQYDWTTILEQPDEDFVSQFDSCVMHNVYMAKAFIPGMIDRGSGRFIGINTECAMLANTESGAYVAAKRGMDGIYRVLAKEVGRYGITVNQVAPGWTVSDRDRNSGSEHQPEHEATIPLARRGTDQEVANAVLFLASDLASYVTGTYLPVAGGTVTPAI